MMGMNRLMIINKVKDYLMKIYLHSKFPVRIKLKSISLIVDFSVEEYNFVMEVKLYSMKNYLDDFF